MNENLSDELISAYLDGELTGAQKTEVEELLMDSLEHRRLFQELRSLRDGLQSLPEFKLGGDFADRVVLLAEEAAASPQTEPESAENELEADGAAALPFPSSHSSASDRGMGRIAISAVVAVAALVLLAIFLGPPNNFTESNTAINENPPNTNRAGDRRERESERRDAANENESPLERETAKQDGFDGQLRNNSNGDDSNATHDGANIGVEKKAERFFAGRAAKNAKPLGSPVDAPVSDETGNSRPNIGAGPVGNASRGIPPAPEERDRDDSPEVLKLVDSPREDDKLRDPSPAAPLAAVPLQNQSVLRLNARKNRSTQLAFARNLKKLNIENHVVQLTPAREAVNRRSRRGPAVAQDDQAGEKSLDYRLAPPVADEHYVFIEAPREVVDALCRSLAQETGEVQAIQVKSESAEQLFALRSMAMQQRNNQRMLMRQMEALDRDELSKRKKMSRFQHAERRRFSGGDQAGAGEASASAPGFAKSSADHGNTPAGVASKGGVNRAAAQTAGPSHRTPNGFPAPARDEGGSFKESVAQTSGQPDGIDVAGSAQQIDDRISQQLIRRFVNPNPAPALVARGGFSDHVPAQPNEAAELQVEDEKGGIAKKDRDALVRVKDLKSEKEQQEAELNKRNAGKAPQERIVVLFIIPVDAANESLPADDAGVGAKQDEK